MIAKTAEDWANSLADHMPQGFALDLAGGGLFRRLFEGLALELARFDALCDELLTELDHSTTIQFISDFERMLDLPRACQSTPAQLTQRRALVAAVLQRPRDLSPATLIEVAAIYGFTITIKEYFPATVPADVGFSPFRYDVGTMGVVQVVDFTTGGSVAGDQLGAVGQLDIACILDEIEPAYAERILV
jgi:uncharacterized protein YmfQ (DUF2313 family)